MRKVPVVIIWAIAFAFVESAVVEYLRAIYYPLERGGFGFPVQSLEYLQSLGDEHMKRLIIELGRELCTLVMLATVGLLAARNFREAMAHFMIAFGVWDIFFYLWLKLFLDWPAGLMTWDLLFLIPVPWIGPVIAPLIISVVMIASGLVVLHYESKDRPLSTNWRDWTAIVGGGLIVITAFCWDYVNVMAGGFPNPFNWPLFLVGLGLSTAAFMLVIKRNRKMES
ncbi:hypothetical protein ACFL2Q_04055 [Thermodesulfobacteriota bacterium]